MKHNKMYPRKYSDSFLFFPRKLYPQMLIFSSFILKTLQNDVNFLVAHGWTKDQL